MKKEQPPNEETINVVVDANYVLFVLGIVVLTLINSVLWFLLQDPETSNALNALNILLSVFLLADAFYRLWRFRSWRYLTHYSGWLTFVGSLPIPFFGLARLIHLWLGVRRIQRNEISEARQVIVTKRAQSTLLFVVLLAIVVYEVAVLMIIAVEGDVAGANIVTASDALWWGYVTVSTVGYGDQFPVTLQGRIVGYALITVGVGLFTSITSFMADWFRRPRSPGPSTITQATAATNDALTLLSNLRRALNEQDRANQDAMATLRAQLDEIERKIIQDSTSNR